ncbi:Pseudaminic acid synthase [compost metagenome]
MKFRRSLYFVKDLKAGDVITEDAVRSVRPGFGLSPKFLQDLIGKKVLQDIAKSTAVSQKNFCTPK